MLFSFYKHHNKTLILCQILFRVGIKLYSNKLFEKKCSLTYQWFLNLSDNTSSTFSPTSGPTTTAATAWWCPLLPPSPPLSDRPSRLSRSPALTNMDFRFRGSLLVTNPLRRCSTSRSRKLRHLNRKYPRNRPIVCGLRSTRASWTHTCRNPSRLLPIVCMPVNNAPAIPMRTLVILVLVTCRLQILVPLVSKHPMCNLWLNSLTRTVMFVRTSRIFLRTQTTVWVPPRRHWIYRNHIREHSVNFQNSSFDHQSRSLPALRTPSFRVPRVMGHFQQRQNYAITWQRIPPIGATFVKYATRPSARRQPSRPTCVFTPASVRTIVVCVRNPSPTTRLVVNTNVHTLENVRTHVRSVTAASLRVETWSATNRHTPRRRPRISETDIQQEVFKGYVT